VGGVYACLEAAESGGIAPDAELLQATRPGPGPAPAPAPALASALALPLPRRRLHPRGETRAGERLNCSPFPRTPRHRPP